MNALTLTLVICSLIAMPEATIVTTLFQGSISILAIALDSEGNILYVSDSNNALYRVTASGKKNTLLAGSGNSTSGTADGVGTLARFNIPQGLTCDDTNDIVFVSDTFNSLVRVVNLATNNVTTLAGSTYGYSDGVGSLAKFQHTTGIALLRSSNIVYVGDSDGSRVRKIEVATANVTTLADFGAPWGVAFVCVSQYGRFVYVALYKISGGSIVARVDTQTSAKTVVAGSNTSSGYADGEGSNALFSTPTGIALSDDESSLVVSDLHNVRVRNIHLLTGIVTTLAGNGSVGATDGPGPLATFGQPGGSLWHCGGTFCGVLLADSSNCALRFLTIESITCSSSNIISGNRSSSMISSSSSSSEATSVSKSPWSSSSGSNSSSVDSLSFSGSPSQRRIFERSTWSFSGTGQVSRSPSNTLSFWLCTVPGDVVTVSLLPISEAAWPEHDLVILSASSSSYIYYDADNQSSNTLPLMTSPISQTVLRSAPYVGLNISFADSAGAAVAHWYVGTATLRDNKTTLQFTNAGTIGTRAHWNAVAFHPPISGWIASSTPLMTATSIAMILTMYCDGAPVFVASLTIPALANPLSYAAQVEATVRYSQVASILAGGASSGSAFGRVMAIRSMVLCDADSAVGGGVIDLSLSICRQIVASDEGAQSVSRSAIVSNVVLIVVVTAILFVLTISWARIAHLSWLASARSLRLPSSLLPVLIAVVPSTASSATLLLGRLRSSACVEVDVVLALFGILMSLLPCAAFVLLWGVKVSSYQWACTSLVEGRKSSRVSRPIQRLRNTFRRDYQWSVASAQTSAPNEELMTAWIILLEYRDLRYGIVDLAVLAGVSCLSVVSGLTVSSAQCRGWSFVVLLLLTLQLVSLVTARRLTTLFSTVYCTTSLCLTIISSLAQLIFVWSYSADTSALWLVDVSAGCSLAVVGLSIVNMIVDGIGLLSAVKRRWRSLLEQQDATSNETNIDTDPDRLPLNQLLQEKTTSGDILEFGDHIVDHDDKDDSLEEILLPESDHLFWDSAGGAVGTGLVDERSDIMQVVTSFRHNLR